MNVPFVQGSSVVGGLKVQGFSGCCQAHTSARLMPQAHACFFLPQPIEVKIFIFPNDSGALFPASLQDHQYFQKDDRMSDKERLTANNLAFPVSHPQLAGTSVGHLLEQQISSSPIYDSFYIPQGANINNNSMSMLATANPIFNIPLISRRTENQLQPKSACGDTCADQRRCERGGLICHSNNILETERDQAPILLNHLQTQEESPIEDPEKSAPAKFIPLRNLRKLYFFLTRFFKCEKSTTSELEQLADHELEILNLILWRKYEGRLFSNETEKEDRQLLVVRLEQFQAKFAVKRAEESFKFIFTRGVKHLKKLLRLNSFADVKNSQNVDHSFFVHYFDDISGPEQSTFKHFLDLSVGKPRKAPSLNLSYFKKVFSCQKFTDDLVQYLRVDFRADYEVEIERKCLQLLIKWDTIFNVKTKSDQPIWRKSLSEVSKYLLQNKRCKLPWTVLEVNNAIARIDGLFTRTSQTENTTDGL